MEELTVLMIVEVLGRPIEHVVEVSKSVVERLEKESGVKVINKKFAEPKKIEQLFSTFCEIEFKVDNFYRLMEICMDYLPSSVEIINPEEIKLNLNDNNAVINYLLAKLHKYEEIVQILNAEREIMFNQLSVKGEKPAFLPILEQLKTQDKELQQQEKKDSKKPGKKQKGKSKKKSG